jgi:hypothetical protein
MKMQKATFQIPQARCLRCGHVWVPRVPHITMCARCKSLYWNRAPEKAAKKTA